MRPVVVVLFILAAIFAVFCCWWTSSLRLAELIGNIGPPPYTDYVAHPQFKFVLDEVLSETPKSRTVAVLGLPLSGKTTLLQEIARTAEVESRYELILWVNFGRGWTLSRELECNSAADLWRLLNTRRLLVVIDDVPHPDAISDISSLITEVSPSFLLYAVSSSLQTIERRESDVVLGGLNDTAAMHLMCLARDVDVPWCVHTCKHSGGYCPIMLGLSNGHPHALLKLGSYRDYASSWEDMLEEFDDIPFRAQDQTSLQHCLSEIWDGALQSLRSSPLAVHIVNVFAFFYRSECVVINWECTRFAMMTRFHDKKSICNAVEILHKRHLVIEQRHFWFSEVRSFKLHPLLLTYVAGQMSEERLAAYEDRMLAGFYYDEFQRTWIE